MKSLQIPATSVKGRYRLKVEGLYDRISGGIAFLNETDLTFSQRSMTVFIQTDKPIYMQGEKGWYLFTRLISCGLKTNLVNCLQLVSELFRLPPSY